MKEISRNEVGEFLQLHSLVLDEWNRPNSSVETQVVQILPEEFGSNLYDVSCVLSSWIGQEENIYLFFDNSTCLTREEPVVFFRCLAKANKTPDSVFNKIYLISQSETKSLTEHYSTLALLINFSILFEWHLEFVSGNNNQLRISDGILYLKAPKLEPLIEVKNMLCSTPIKLAKWQKDSEIPQQ